MPPSRGSFQPRNQTQVSCIYRQIFFFFFFFLTTEALGKPHAFWSSYLGEGVSVPREDIFLVLSMALWVIDIFSRVNSDFHLVDNASL